MFDWEGPALGDLPTPLVVGGCDVSDIAIEEEEAAGCTEEETVK